MGITILTNPASLGAQRNLNNTNERLSGNIQRLSSGLRINRAADDAAGLGISEKLKAQIRGLAQAQHNAQDAISLTQTAEGALNEIHGILSRMRELAVQSANGTLGDSERDFIETEFVQLRSEIARITSVTEFNGKYLLSGAGSIDMQVGIMNTADDRIKVSLMNLHMSNLGAAGAASGVAGVSLSTAVSAQTALNVFDEAIHDISEVRARLGAVQNRISVTINNLSIAHENLSAANSRIRDVDVAEETAAFTRNQILTQAGVSVLAQANQLPAMALSLLG